MLASAARQALGSVNDAGVGVGNGTVQTIGPLRYGSVRDWVCTMGHRTLPVPPRTTRDCFIRRSLSPFPQKGWSSGKTRSCLTACTILWCPCRNTIARLATGISLANSNSHVNESAVLVEGSKPSNVLPLTIGIAPAIPAPTIRRTLPPVA
jgi:hypothetical protein